MTTIDDLVRRLDALESESAIRRLMAAYEEARDVQQDSEEFARLFTPDGIWEAVGPMAAVLGCHQGREAIARRTAASIRMAPFTAHFLANEAITIEGETASGRWAFLQAATTEGVATWVAGHYHVDFVRDDGRWLIRHLRLNNVFVTPYEEGWAKTRFATVPFDADALVGGGEGGDTGY